MIQKSSLPANLRFVSKALTADIALRQVAQTWKMPPREWCEAKTQFAIMFDDRFVKA